MPVEEYCELNTFEEAVEAMVGGLEKPMTWNYWQSCISKLAKHFKHESAKYDGRDAMFGFAAAPSEPQQGRLATVLRGGSRRNKQSLARAVASRCWR